jgi:hypothetical protein
MVSRKPLKFNRKTSKDNEVPAKEAKRGRQNLTTAKTYLVNARAIGGSTGASAWISTGSIVCT